MKSFQNLFKTKYGIPLSTPLVVSVSGGIDSMVLFHMLKQTNYPIVVVHFNHLKRDESLIEKDLVEKTCNTYEVPFHYYTISVTDGNFHHQAHLLRKHYLEEVANLYHTPYILTAHHLDDLFENVLIKLTRGSNLLGYAGMQEYHETTNYIYIKPLLYMSKKEIHAYAKEFQVNYLDDSSNEENTYLRNRYRHSVVPIMKQENETLLVQIKQYHHQITQAFNHIRNITKKSIENDTIFVDAFVTWDDALKDDAIAYLIENQDLVISYEIIQKIKKMLQSNKPNAIYRLSKNHYFIKSYNNAFIKPLTDKENTFYLIKEGDTKIKNVAIFTLLSKTNANTEEFHKLCYNKLAFPLILRHRLEGDQLSYSYGHKKLKKLLIDEKIPMIERDTLWVLTDQDGTILWVEKHYINQMLGNENILYFKMNEVAKHA